MIVLSKNDKESLLSSVILDTVSKEYNKEIIFRELTKDSLLLCENYLEDKSFFWILDVDLDYKYFEAIDTLSTKFKNCKFIIFYKNEETDSKLQRIFSQKFSTKSNVRLNKYSSCLPKHVMKYLKDKNISIKNESILKNNIKNICTNKDILYNSIFDKYDFCTLINSHKDNIMIQGLKKESKKELSIIKDKFKKLIENEEIQIEDDIVFISSNSIQEKELYFSNVIFKGKYIIEVQAKDFTLIIKTPEDTIGTKELFEKFKVQEFFSTALYSYKIQDTKITYKFKYKKTLELFQASEYIYTILKENKREKE